MRSIRAAPDTGGICKIRGTVLLGLSAFILVVSGSLDVAALYRIPNVKGQQIDEAVQTLRASLGKATCITGVPEDLAGGVDRSLVIVVDQGTEETENAFCVTLTAGSEVPDLKGETSLTAATEVKRHGLNYDPRPAANDDWLVVSQVPDPGRPLQLGGFVEVQLAAPVVVPNLSGLDEDRAREILVEAGLVLDLNLLSDGQRPGQVVGQDPEAGTQVLPGAPVTVSVRRVSAPPPVMVPRLIGSSADAARTAVAAAGLIFKIDPTSVGGSSARVISQWPSPGTRVRSGTTITVTLGVTESASPSQSLDPSDSASPSDSPGPSESARPSQSLDPIRTVDKHRADRPWLFLVLPAAALLLGMVLAGLANRAVHRRRSNTRSPGRIEAIAHADPDPHIDVPVENSHLDIAVNLEPHGGNTTVTTKEVHR
jgi:beta-lactam-binding protein with PASTA domain